MVSTSPLISKRLVVDNKSRNSEISHIASGFLYNSPSQNKVRADAAADGQLLSSLFDYDNVTNEGVANRVWTLSPAITSAPQIWSGFVEPGFPLISPNLLVDSAAVFQGVVNDEELGREVTAVSLRCYWGPNLHFLASN